MKHDNLIKHFTHGIEPRNPRLVKSPRVWWKYLNWCIYTYLQRYSFVYPMFIRKWAYRRYGERRYWLSNRTYAYWRETNPDWIPSKESTPLPWYIGEAGMGPVRLVWKRFLRIFSNQKGEYSHRCEFTDREKGALYGGKEGAFMNRLFEQFLENIE